MINLKFGRANALRLLDEVLAPEGRLQSHCSNLRVRHLFHDRDEFTLGAVLANLGKGAGRL